MLFRSYNPKKYYTGRSPLEALSIGGSSLTAYHGNTDLKAQTSQYTSISVEYAGSKFQASLTGYANFIRNMIELVEIKVTPEEKLLEIEKSKKYTNLTKARIYGIDFTFNYRPTKDIMLGGGYSYADPKAQYAADTGDNYMKYLYIDANQQIGRASCRERVSSPV